MSHKSSLTAICKLFSVSRQAYYQAQQTAEAAASQEAMIISIIKEIRRLLPFCGTRKLHHDLKDLGVDIGRDKLFKLLKKHDLLVKPKRNYMRTTNSKHRFKKYANQIKNVVINRPNQVFVSDITYLKTREGFCYLALVTDAFSRKIVGHDLSQSLAMEGAHRALQMALTGVSKSDKLIHHSDRGLQYCSNPYCQTLENKGCIISMTEDDHVYENALAERVNGILKQEFMLGHTLQSFKVAKELVTQSICIYNNRRRHLSLYYKTPEQVYRYASFNKNIQNLYV